MRFANFKKDIALLLVDPADKSMPVWNQNSIHQFHERVQEFLQNKEWQGLIVASEHKEFFAGADLKSLMPLHELERMRPMSRELTKAFRDLEKDPRPVVAIVHGNALGGGYELALACNHRIGVKNPSARIALPETSLGLIPGAGGTQRLPRLIGVAAALPLMSEGRKLSFEKALEAKLLDGLVATKEQAMVQAEEFIRKNPQVQAPWDLKTFRMPGLKPGTADWNAWFMGANAFLKKKTFGNYPAQQALISSVYEGCALPYDMGQKIELRYFEKVLASPEANAMTRTFFFSLGELNSGGKRPKGPAARTFQTLGMVGAGMMGRGIAFVSAQAGMKVILKDTSIESAHAGKVWIAAGLDKEVQKGRLSVDKKNEILGRVQVAETYQDFATCDLIIEAVIEDRKIKKEVFAEVCKVVSKDCVIASNTSTLPISGLAEYVTEPQRFVGIHFFSPVERMALVEIIRGQATAEETVAWSLDYVKGLKKTPIIVNDGRGFYTSRVFISFVNEGFALLKEGVNPALIENCGKQIGMPIGPLTVADEVSLDLVYHVAKQTVEDTGNIAAKASFEIADRFVNKLSRPGRKAKKGIYEYPEGAKKFLWPQLREIFPSRAQELPAETVKSRLLYAQLLEAARAMEEGVLLTPEDGDIGSIFGWGFCPQTGGIFSCMDSLGLTKVIADCEALQKEFGDSFLVPQILYKMQKENKNFY